MPNSNQEAGRFHKWLPKWLKAFLFLALCICITSALNYGFIDVYKRQYLHTGTRPFPGAGRPAHRYT